MTENARGVELDVQVQAQKDTEIRLAYELRNTTRARIFVFDHILYFDSKGAISLSNTGSYVFFDHQETARIIRGFIAPPMYMSVARRPPIVASAVDPGWASAGLIELPLPLAETNPYFPPQTCDPRAARPISRLRLQVGWVEEREGLRTGVFKVDERSLVRLLGGWGTPLQRVAQTDIGVTGVAICVHSDPFDRPQLQQ